MILELAQETKGKGLIIIVNFEHFFRNSKIGGNLDSAVEKYLLFIATQDQSATPETIDFIRQRIEQILALHGVEKSTP